MFSETRTCGVDKLRVDLSKMKLGSLMALRDKDARYDLKR